MTSVIVGLLLVLGGLWSIDLFLGELIVVLKGTVSLVLLSSGAIAVIAGVSSMRDGRNENKREK